MAFFTVIIPLYNKESYVENMYTVWIKYWPQKRFQTDDQYTQWLKSNKNMADTFRTSAENVVELLSKYKLVNFK